MSLGVKRPLAEPTQTIQEPAPIVPQIVGSSSVTARIYKRIRLTARKATGAPVSILAYVNLLEDAANSNDALQILIKISDAMQFDETEFPEAIRKLVEHFQREQESAVRVKILSLFGDLATETGIDGPQLIDEVIGLLKAETSAKVISQGLLALDRIGRACPTSVAYINKMVFFAKSKLFSSSHNVQRHAILLLGAFVLVSDAEKESLELIGKYTDSQDARVRAQAFRSILAMGERGVSLPATLYARACAALNDDYECVRKEALQLVYEMGIRHPEGTIVVSDSEQEIRLIDDAFGKVCNAICDLSMHIRTLAAELLGGMTMVNDEFLHQTLDKKLMSNMRRKKSLHERNAEHFTSGEWSSGKKWADDAPKELVNAESVSLMASGACGALVQGLEDEFLEVRTASVNSMCKLALKNPPFAVTSLDFLVDMFNDEIEEVRLRAIYSLTAISKHIILREDQLETMLSSLEDYSVEVREGLHLMLGACKVSTKACLSLVVQKVLDVLLKYPEDRLSTFGCMQRVGQKHPEICMSLTPQLLQDHPFFDSAERDVEDPSYVCILIMLFNAAQHLPPMLSLFPETIVKHYAYLRDTMPSFVPHLNLGGQSTELTLTGSTGSRQFLETILNNTQLSYSAPQARQALLKSAQENLDRLAEIDPSFSGTANFTAVFLGTQLLMEQLQGATAGQPTKAPLKESLSQLIRKCLKLQNLFSNLTLDDHLLVKQMCLRASALNLVLVVKDRTQSALAPCQLLLHIAADASNYLQEHNTLVADSFTSTILTKLASIGDPRPGRVFREILPVVQAAPPVVVPQINTNIKMSKARILEPSENCFNSDNVIKVTAGLIAAVPLVAELENLQECQRQDLRLKIKYPDQNVHIIVPRKRDLKKIMTEEGESESHWRLRTTVLLSHSVWTEASPVDISICLAVRPSSDLELCKSVKVQFSPKPVKRGI
ncbi:integrator complex subunit 4 [Toxorhynchites rutilus septentrionalis]|uniref:integrator complex subunit 4 n=1 Tax=Toxorhynchites rutilus septentrionalis TaxID=329112 RepID=UPI00247996E4|nr:integrator complex subunit 4 [Toxorhynchites rutilus septentrionalis]